MSEPTWEALAAAHGIRSNDIDSYIQKIATQQQHDVPAASVRKPRKPIAKRIAFPDRIPTADAMLDEMAMKGFYAAASLYESCIFDYWLNLQAKAQGLRPPLKRMRTEEFMRRYWGPDSPERLDEKD